MFSYFVSCLSFRCATLSVVHEGLLSRGVVTCGWAMEAWLVDFLSILLAGVKLGGDEDGSGDEECY